MEDPMSTTGRPLHLHQDRLFPSDPTQRAIARRLYAQVEGLPLVSPHGHTDPSWFAGNANFANATELLLVPDHYVSHDVFGLRVRLDADTADQYYDTITAALQTEAYRPRALFERFDIEVIATTEGPLDPLVHHQSIRDSG